MRVVDGWGSSLLCTDIIRDLWTLAEGAAERIDEKGKKVQKNERRARDYQDVDMDEDDRPW